MEKDYSFYDMCRAEFNTFIERLKDELPYSVRHNPEWFDYVDYKCNTQKEKFEEVVAKFRERYRNRSIYYFSHESEEFFEFTDILQKELTELFAYLLKKERAKLITASTVSEKLKYIQPRKFYRFTRWDYCLIRFNLEKERSRRKLPSTQRQGFDDKCKSITEELKGKLKELQEEENCNMMYYLAALRHYQKKMDQIHRS